jgi:hypothetical protein
VPANSPSPECSSSTGYIISSPDDADGISGCATFDGSVSLQFADDPSAWSSGAEVDLGKLTTILGNLTIYPDARHEKTRVTGSKLEKVGGGITIWNTDFSSTVDAIEVSFPSLGTVEDTYAVTGGIRTINIKQSSHVETKNLFRVWSSAAEEFSMAGLTVVDGEAEIDSNSDLKKLDLKDLTEIGSSLRVQTNPKLSSINFEKLGQVNGDLRFYQNGGLTALNLPNLEFADTISFTENGPNPYVSLPKLTSLGKSNTTQESTFGSVEAITLPVLSQVNGGLAFLSTNLFELTVPALKTLNGSITVKNNDALTTFALPRVETIGDIFIESNSKLGNVTANALASAGSVSIKGNNLVNVELFGLKKVTGNFKVSGADSMDCTWFDAHIRPITAGIFSCSGSYDKPAEERKPSTGGIENAPTDTKDSGSDQASTDSSKSGSSGLSSGAKAGIGIGIALVAVIAGLVVFFVLRRKRNTRGREQVSDDPNEQSKVETDSSSAEVYDGIASVKMGVETTIQAMSPKEEKRQSFLNFRLSSGPLNMQGSPGHTS